MREVRAKAAKGERQPNKYRKGICQKCGEDRWLHKHHIVPRLQGGSNVVDNILWLCANCHEDEHGGVAGANLRRTPEAEAKRRAGIAAKWADPDWKTRRLAEMREALKSVDHKAKGRKTAAAWTPEKRAAHAQRVSEAKRSQHRSMSEEQKQKLSAIHKKRYAEGYINPRRGKGKMLQQTDPTDSAKE